MGARDTPNPAGLDRDQPVEQYTLAYDRARRPSEGDRGRDSDDRDERPPSPWHTHWTESDYIELEELEREYRPLPSRSNPFADELGEFARERIA